LGVFHFTWRDVAPAWLDCAPLTTPDQALDQTAFAPVRIRPRMMNAR